MFVVDSSMAASWCLPDESSVIADAVLTQLADERAVAPTLLWFEFRNMLLTNERRGRISELQSARFLSQLRVLPIEIDSEPDEVATLHLARAHRLTVYDAVYLELALRKSLPLATLDDALVKAARAEKIALIGRD